MKSRDIVIRLILGSAVTIAFLAGPAAAQQVPKYGETDQDKTPAEIAAAKEAEKAYQRSLGNIPAQKSTDPWGAVRSEDTPKSAAKTAAKTVSPKPKAAKSETKPDGAAKQ